MALCCMICKLVSIICSYTVIAKLLGTSCPGYELSWVRVVLGTSCLGFELSWVRVVLGTSCPEYELSWVRVVHNPCSPSTHLIRCALQVGTRWALQKGNGEQNISWVSDVYWVSTRWALGEYWQRCLRRCALGEYCTCLEVCTRWALDLVNLRRWILIEYWT